MSWMEAGGGMAGGGLGTLAKGAGVVAGVAAGFSMHESIDTDERAIILNRGRVALDTDKTKDGLGTTSVREARRILAELQAAGDTSKGDVAEYAKEYGEGGRFKFFSLRSIRKVKTNSKTSGLPKQNFDLLRGLWIMDSSVTWEVGSTPRCAARALLRASSPEELNQRVVASTAGAARESILEIDVEDPLTIFKSSDVFDRIMAKVGEELESDFGTLLKKYEITDFGPAPAERQRRIIFEGPGGEKLDPRTFAFSGLHLVSPASSEPAATAGA